MLDIDATKTIENLVVFLKTSFGKAGFSRAVIALSGGVDSTTSCALVVKALGAENVYPVLLPCGTLNSQDVLDAMNVISWLTIPLKNITRIDIQPAVERITRHDPGMDQLRRGNIMARLRMTYLFDQAKKRQALVVGTGNKSEHLLGYYTRFGDEASDIEPLRNLYKTQVYQLAKHLGLPEAILAKSPSAGLWVGQTDEGELGFTYKEADEILSLSFDEKRSVSEIAAAGFSREVVDKVLARVSANDFKHHVPILP